jgi:hypothetical protein
MYRKGVFLIKKIFWVIFLFPVTATPSPSYSLQSVNENELTIKFIDNSPCGADTTLFAFATQPGNSFSVIINITDDKSKPYPVPFRRLSSGWAGTNFLQWISFSLCGKYNYMQKVNGEIKVIFDSPVLQGIRSSDISLHNGICSIPFRQPLQKSAAQVEPSVPFTRGVRIWVDKDGIYEITPSALKSLGVPVGSINSKTYRLFEKNNEVPVYITNPQHSTLQDGDRILFYGRYLRNEKGNYTQFSNTNVYWLSWGMSNGARIAEASGDMKRSSSLFYTDPNKTLSALDFIDTIHFEQDNLIYWFGSTNVVPTEWVQESPGYDTLDNWYWGTVGSSDSLDKLDTFMINVPSPSAEHGFARLRVALMGITTVDGISPDHHVQILLNQQSVGGKDSAVWDGQHEFIYQSDSFSVAKLLTGKNTVFMLRPNRGYPDKSALNWIELIYLRGYKALDNKLFFKNSPNAVGKIVEYTLKGFTSDKLELWDVQRGRYLIDFSVTPGKGEDRGRYNLGFQDSISSPVRYFAQTIDNRLSPAKMTLDTIKTAIDSAAQADYIVISVDSFRTVFDTLRMAHERKGLKTAFIDIDDIYNRFSYGIRDPECIRTFLGHLFTIAKNHFPRYLLLGGDTTHDLDKKNQNRNLVPTHLSRTPGWGPSADDGYFVTFRGDDNFADMCVGRFPGQNRTEIKTMIDKTVKYINSPDKGFWRDNLLLLGGGEKEFTDFNDEAVADAIGPKMNIIRMDANPASIYYKDDQSAPGLIADQINAGCFMINFNGHGGNNIWSDNNFFSYSNLGLLYNGKWGKGSRLPVVFSFTCLTGFFESSDQKSLGENFVKTSANGAVAFYGASAYTSRNGNMAMNRLMLEEALSGSFETLGDLVDFCEMNMLVRYGIQYIHLVRQYNILGDPALPWILTPDTLKLSLQKTAISKGDSLIVDGSCKPVSSGQVRIVAKSGDKVWNQTIDNVSSGSFKRIFTVKDSAATSSGIVRAYAWNDSSEVRGWCNFTKDTLMVQNVKLSISQPVFGDSVFVSCDLPVPDTSIQAMVYCTYAIAANYSGETSLSGVPMERNSSGEWVTINKIPLTFSGNVNDRLILVFKVKSDLGTKQSEIFTYPIAGRPDLTFTKDGAVIGWANDSLSISFQVLNMGNAAAPPFDITFFYGDRFSRTDTICKILSRDSLYPGKIRSFTATIPDTQGTIDFTGVINSGSTFTEILTDNNSFTGHIHIASRYMKNITDTLFSNGKGLRISPSSQWSAERRVFLFDMLPSDTAPLKTRSSWVPLAKDSVTSFRIFVRKPLENSDSLQLQFIPDNTPLDKNLQSVSGRKAVMFFDSTILRWRSLGGETGNDSSLIIKTVHSGPFSLANITDNSAPDVVVSVHGRILNRLDYAAKDKPFSISIADPSEILPSSVEFFLNGKKLSSDTYSGLPLSGDLSTMSITAYPKAQERIDSLEITAEDLAKNKVSRVFAYMPGANLSIQFFSCHPNPFSAKTDYNGEIRKTRFAFLLTDIASSAKLSIYTVSGKKIRSWNLADLLGYQEIEWDGRDEQGYRIANGTYYAKLTAENDNRKVKKIIRIAKLEGY